MKRTRSIFCSRDFFFVERARVLLADKRFALDISMEQCRTSACVLLTDKRTYCDRQAAALVT